MIKERGRTKKNPNIFPPCQIEFIVFGSGLLKLGACPNIDAANIQKNKEDISKNKGKYMDIRIRLFFIFGLFRRRPTFRQFTFFKVN